MKLWMFAGLFLVIFEGAPQPRDEDIAHLVPASVRAASHFGTAQHAGEGKAGELGALIRGDDPWLAEQIRLRIQSGIDQLSPPGGFGHFASTDLRNGRRRSQPIRSTRPTDGRPYEDAPRVRILNDGSNGRGRSSSEF